MITKSETLFCEAQKFIPGGVTALLGHLNQLICLRFLLKRL